MASLHFSDGASFVKNQFIIFLFKTATHQLHSHHGQWSGTPDHNNYHRPFNLSPPPPPPSPPSL